MLFPIDFLNICDKISKEKNIGGVFQMAYKITDDCISCGACASECPVDAISEGDGKFVVDANECIECGACAGACPVDAPVLDE